MGWKIVGVLVALGLVGGCPGSDDGDTGSTDVDGGTSGAAADTEGGYPIVPCPDDLPEFALGLEASGDQKHYKISIEDALPSPPMKFTNDWTITVLDMDGQPAADADLYEARPFMPAHGHDGTFPPVITPLDGDGEYQVDDINMWMRGPWEVQFHVRGDAGEDYIVFNVCIEG